MKLTFYVGLDGTICNYGQTDPAYFFEETKHSVYRLVELN